MILNFFVFFINYNNIVIMNNVMLVCMVSYMTADYGHVNHAFKVNVCS